MFLGRIKTRKKNTVKLRIGLVLILLISVLTIYFVYLDKKIMPNVQALGELKAQEITTKAINESVNTILKQDIQYKDLMYIKEDADGNVTMMQANTILMNKIAADVAITIQNYLSNTTATAQRIPLGNILGSQILAQYGPKVKLQVTPQGAVDVNFGTEFGQAGINQTRHRIYLIINTSVKVIIPFSSDTIHVTTYFPVAETIIVGKVPTNYISVPENGFFNLKPLNEK